LTIRDELHADALAVCDWLRAEGCELALLSGDDERGTAAVAQALGIVSEAAESRRSPAGKALSIRRGEARGPVAMVGNGFNDALALGAATVGVAVCGAMPAAREAADVVLVTDGLAPLRAAVSLSRAATRALRRGFWFSGTYNLLTMALAATGHVTPLVAAVLMPVNSVVVTLLVTRWQAPPGGRTV
jgi:Cu2+-exporting ATPase